MTTVVAEIKALLSGARTAVAIAKQVDSSEALQARFDESGAEVHRDLVQVSYAVCKALIAHALGREPSNEEVDAFMTAAVNDPAFPHRAYRLLGEARKAASRRRRAFLASTLFGLPFAKLPDDERDRVDMAVESLTVADVEFLWMVSEKRTDESNLAPAQRHIFGPTGVAALIQGTSLRIATTADFNKGQFSVQVFEHPSFAGDRTALSALVSAGCLDVGPAVLNYSDGGKAHHLIVTLLGDLVIRALTEVRAGFDGIKP